MKSAPLPPDEDRRLEALRAYAVLDSPPERDFEEIAQLTAQLCDAPIALISLVDERRQWFKARIGLSVASTAREVSFCAHALAQRELFIVPDATRDDRFADNPLVTGDPRIRFYAGAPLQTPEGQILGTLCVIDHVPRELLPAAQEALRILARQVMAQLDLRRRTRELARREQYFRNLIDALPVAVCTIDAAGRLTLYNQAAVKLWGRTPVLGVDHWCGSHATFTAEGTPVPREGWAFTFPQRKDHAQAPTGFISERPDGSRTHFLAYPNPIFDEGGEFAGAILVLVEIDDRKAEEVSLRKAFDDLRHDQEILLHQERLHAFGQMASGIAHDVNNAICPVSIYTKVLLQTDATLSPMAREYLEIIRQAALSVGETVARLRRFYRERGDRTDFAPVDVPALIGEVIALTHARWSELAGGRGTRIEVRTEVEPALPAIPGIASEIREALVNLVFNAVDAMPEGGMLTIRAHMAHDTARGVARVAVTVADSGGGMDEDARRRCFDPFFTTKGERGTGLGLAIVAGIVQRHDAEISVESAPGEGTTMRILFPLSSEPGRDQPAQDSPSHGRPMKILVAEDDALILRALRVSLEAAGHQPQCVLGGQAAITCFRAALEAGAPFDVVLTDLGMAHVDGRRVAQAVKLASPSTPVILLTGWGHSMQVDQELPLGVDRLLAKPVAPEDLWAALEACRRSEIS